MKNFLQLNKRAVAAVVNRKRRVLQKGCLPKRFGGNAEKARTSS